VGSRIVLVLMIVAPAFLASTQPTAEAQQLRPLIPPECLWGREWPGWEPDKCYEKTTKQTIEQLEEKRQGKRRMEPFNAGKYCVTSPTEPLFASECIFNDVGPCVKYAESVRARQIFPTAECRSNMHYQPIDKE